jgi:hypothetical protein
MNARPIMVVLLVGLLASVEAYYADAAPVPLFFYASQPGRLTLDSDEEGGNPFASALIELLSRQSVTLSAFSSELARLTDRKSHGFQHPEVPPNPEPAAWTINPKRIGETRTALVVVFSDYSVSSLESLPGAKFDATRVSKALSDDGFYTETVLDPSRVRLEERLKGLAAKSREFDVAVIYATAHGMQNDGIAYLLPGDFSVDGDTVLGGIPVMHLAEAAQAKRINLVFSGACRN